MKEYQEARRDLAEAMGWREGTTTGLPGLEWIHPDGMGEFLPDPLNYPQHAEQLEAWLNQQGYLCVTRTLKNRAIVDLRPWPSGSPEFRGVVEASAEPDPATRRRLALIWAADQAVSGREAMS